MKWYPPLSKGRLSEEKMRSELGTGKNPCLRQFGGAKKKFGPNRGCPLDKGSPWTRRVHIIWHFGQKKLYHQAKYNDQIYFEF